MAGRKGGRSGGRTAGGTLAPAAVKSAIAAGTVGNMSTRRTTGTTVREQGQTCEQIQTQEDMRMCRHANRTSEAVGFCTIEKQLWELNQILDYQNKILTELLQAVREPKQG